MATSKTLNPTNVSISIPALGDAPDASVFSNCIDKEADAINALNSQITTQIISVQAYDNRVSWDATGDPAIIKKVGNVCMLSGYITYQFNPTSPQTSVIVLPSGCIPAVNVYGVCVRNSDRKIFMTQVSSSGNFNIFNDGQISSGDKIYIGFTYIVG